MDIEKVISNIAADIAKTLVGKTSEYGAKQYRKALTILETCVQKYLRHSYQRYSKIKTLLYRDRPVDLKSHYVVTDFTLGDNKKISGEGILQEFRDHKKNVIVGTAGSGKSVLLRRLFIDLVENHTGLVPILLELRLLITPNKKYSILEYVAKMLLESDDKFVEDQLHYALKTGKVCLMLDGFDEIDYDQRHQYEREILDLSRKYVDSVIVVSSRPDDTFSSWEQYYIYRALPLNKVQAVDLVSRIEYEKTTKRKFISELENGLYEKHEDFLSNPLLLTMMLLTYEQLAEIPEKIHIFYEQAFETLYHKHDALKSMYKRKTYAGLPVDDFKSVFSVFCIVTLSERKMTFTYGEILRYIGKAVKYQGLNVDSRDFFDDLTKSVCVVQKDGNVYTFTHRSFQEYFAAYFISFSQTVDTKAVMDKIAVYGVADSVVPLLFELNREKFEKQWVIPTLEEIIAMVPESLNNRNVVDFLSEFYEALAIGPGRSEENVVFRLGGDKPLGYFSVWMRRLYRDEADKFFPLHPDEDEETQRRRSAQEVDILKRHLSFDRNGEVNFDEVSHHAECLSETDLPKYVERKLDYVRHLHSLLSQKYIERRNDLTALLLGDVD